MLNEEQLKMREIVHIDIAHDPVLSADFKEDEDPTKFRSVKTGRGPLTSPNWKNEVRILIRFIEKYVTFYSF